MFVLKRISITLKRYFQVKFSFFSIVKTREKKDREPGTINFFFFFNMTNSIMDTPIRSERRGEKEKDRRVMVAAKWECAHSVNDMRLPI